MQIALHTSWGLVTLDPFCFAVKPGDYIVILGNQTLKLLGTDVYDSLGARARERAALTGVHTAAYRQCRRVTGSFDAFQQQTSLSPEDRDETVDRLVARGPDIDMSPEEELRARSEALEGAVQAWRLLDCKSRMWSVFPRSLVGAGMRFGVGYAGVTRTRV